MSKLSMRRWFRKEYRRMEQHLWLVGGQSERSR